MIWYRAFLETRARFFLAFAMMIWMVLVMSPEVRTMFGAKPTPWTVEMGLKALATQASGGPAILWGLFAVTLAGAGINTQTVSSTRQGLHGSVFYTLSMPVSRRRLLLTRAATGYIGWLILAVSLCFAMWLASPSLRSLVTFPMVAGYAISLFFGTLVFGAVSVLLATVLDEMWQFYISCAVVIAAIMFRPGIGSEWDMFRVLGDRSIPAMHGIWWPGFAVSVLISSAILFIAIQVIERKEY